MAKDAERKVARLLFVERGKSRKEIAADLGVREKTVGEWAARGNWEDQRTAHLTSTENVVATLKGLIQTYAEQLKALEEAQGVNPREKARLVDALVKTSKSLDVVRSEHDITLSTRLKVMEWVFSELQKHNATVHHQLVDFQASLLDEAARMHA